MSDMDMTAMGDAGKAMPVPRGQYSDTETYDYLDFVYSGDASYIAKKLTTGNPPAENNEYWQLFARGGTLTENSDVSNTTVTFETAETRSNIFSKESLSIIAGKVSKMYSDLKAVAFSGKYTDIPDRLTLTNNDLANVPGTAWDAVRGAQIRKDLDKLNSDLDWKSKTLNKPFSIVNEEMVIEVNELINVKDCVVYIGIPSAGSTITACYIPLSEVQTGFRHYSPQSNLSFDGKVYRRNTAIHATLTQITGWEPLAVKIINILYR